MEIDHLNLSPTDRILIEKATQNSARVFLSSMDKGLSGSDVWQARWLMPDGKRSKLHIFKIGELDKLEPELEAVERIASVIEPDFPLTGIYTATGTTRALLRQQFQGSLSGDNTYSLRNFIRLPRFNATPDQVSTVINRLFSERMKQWHFDDDAHVDPKEEQNSIKGRVPWWESKIDLVTAAKKLGYESIDADLRKRHGLSVEQLATLVEEAMSEVRTFRIGPVHGDLHAANVNLDDNLQVYLIDFANTAYNWRGLDFVILEAAIKFAASPAHSPVGDLLVCEELIDTSSAPSNISEEQLYCRGRQNVLAACVAIRERCRASGAEPNMRNYRSGLICVAAAFTSIEWLVNRRFLFHSIAYQCKKLAELD